MVGEAFVVAAQQVASTAAATPCAITIAAGIGPNCGRWPDVARPPVTTRSLDRSDSDRLEALSKGRVLVLLGVTVFLALNRVAGSR